MVFPVVLALGHNDGDDDHGAEHANRPSQQEGLPSNSIYDHNGRNSRQHVDDADDPGSKKGNTTRIQAKALENRRSIVNDGVNSTPLLEEHDETGNGYTLEIVPGAKNLRILSELEVPHAVTRLSKARKLPCKHSLFEEHS